MTACHSPLPQWFDRWEHWRMTGAVPKERPAGVPQHIPVWAWTCLRERNPLPPKPLPVRDLPFTPPVAFYRAPNDLTVGITEALAVWKDAVAIDPLSDGSWHDFITACRARGRSVYGWTRVTDRARWSSYLLNSTDLDGHFPNIEDDDLRADPGLPLFVVDTSVPRRLLGVLTNYFVSNQWPTPNPLGHLPVLPEWFPSEIHDPTATLEGSLDSGRKHFAAALPLLDGRERGLAAFPYPAGAYCIWPADSVTDFKGWVR